MSQKKENSEKLKLVLPKGKLYKNVIDLLNEAGYGIEVDERVYIPRIKDATVEAKVLKAQNIPLLVQRQSHDAGFSGFDWIEETQSDVEQLLDVGFDPVSIVAAVGRPYEELLAQNRPMVVASEYETLTKNYMKRLAVPFVFQRTFGATEVFPPDDADMIVDNMATGRTLTQHKLLVKDVLLRSSTRFVANRQALADPWKRQKLEEMVCLFSAILAGRQRVILEMNISAHLLPTLVQLLPSMRSPTIAQLYGQQGFAVKVAVVKEEVRNLIPQLKRLGATDILEYDLRKVIV
ncbi:MAG: ATP phosphoribosyltransferase [Chitinivibrionales bacterium]|nr:ATP phosphoribosyltransferase [Chitinivibrionales bacterium]